MATIPTEFDKNTAVTPDREATIGTRWQKVVGIMGVAVVLWVGGNLFDTVTSGGSGPRGGADHGPPGGAPAGEEPPSEAPPDEAPPGDEPHDPSQRDHG